MFLLGLCCFGFNCALCFPLDSMIFWLHVLWLSDICFMFHFSLFSMFSSCALCFIISISQTLQFPLTLPYYTSLIILRSHSCILLWRIQSLVYISHVLVLQTSELILLILHSYSLRFFRTLGSSSSAPAVSSLLYSWSCSSRHTFWWGQSIAIHRTQFFALPSVRLDPVRSKHNNLWVCLYLWYAWKNCTQW